VIRIEEMLHLKNKLKNAFKEGKQIEIGEKKGISFSHFLNEM